MLSTRESQLKQLQEDLTSKEKRIPVIVFTTSQEKEDRDSLADR